MNIEIWKDIEGYEGLYQISNSGNVKSVRYQKDGKYNKSSKKVRQIKLDGTFVKDWDSLADIGRELHKLIGHISNCCRGKRKTAFGYKWEFII